MKLNNFEKWWENNIDTNRQVSNMESTRILTKENFEDWMGGNK